MTSVKVTGVLKTPLDVGMDSVTVRITSTTTEGDTLGSVESKVVTGSDGSYDFNLVYGVHDIEIKDDDEYSLSGRVRVDATVTAPTTLPNLLINHLAN